MGIVRWNRGSSRSRAIKANLFCTRWFVSKIGSVGPFSNSTGSKAPSLTPATCCGAPAHARVTSTKASKSTKRLTTSQRATRSLEKTVFAATSYVNSTIMAGKNTISIQTPMSYLISLMSGLSITRESCMVRRRNRTFGLSSRPTLVRVVEFISLTI